eukprot:NODE_24_length_41419_cov_0.818780.p9 type:complete len:369 gc:universal NODE_24_length_41419_cov_0.818780:7081-5975(-)
MYSKYMLNSSTQNGERLLYFETGEMLKYLLRCASKNSSKSTVQVFKESLNRQVEQSENMKTNLKRIADTTNNLPKLNIQAKQYDMPRKIIDNLKSSPIGTTFKFLGDTIEHIADHPYIKTNLQQLREEAVQFGGMPPRELREVIRARKMAQTVIKESDETEMITSSTWKLKNPFSDSLSKFSKSIDNSNSTTLLVARDMIQNITNFTTSLLQPSEQAKLISEIRGLDPLFHPDIFLQDCRSLFIPEIIESIIENNQQRLSEWMNESSLNIVKLMEKEFADKKWANASQLIDIRDTQLLKIVREEGKPVLLVTSLAEELTIFKVGDKIVAGTDQKLTQYRYVFVFTVDENNIHNPVTRGWKVVQFNKSN